MGTPSRRRKASPPAQQQTRQPTRGLRANPAPIAFPASGLGDGAVGLRAPRESDAHAIAKGCSDSEVARWTKVPSPYTLEDARAWIASAEVQRGHGSELPLVIVQADRVVGGVSLRLRSEPEPHGDIGYWVAAGARRLGVGSRAVRLLAQHGLESLGLRWIEIVVAPQNEPSRRLALSAGFEPYAVELREFKGAMEEFMVLRRRSADSPD